MTTPVKIIMCTMLSIAIIFGSLIIGLGYTYNKMVNSFDSSKDKLILESIDIMKDMVHTMEEMQIVIDKNEIDINELKIELDELKK